MEDGPVPLVAPAVDGTPAIAPATPAAAPAVTPAGPAVTPVVPEEQTVIEDEEVPLAVMDEEEPEELQNIEDEEVPLADMPLVSGVQHTVQHILELGGAGLLPLLLAGSNRKKKKEVTELKKRLENGDKD